MYRRARHAFLPLFALPSMLLVLVASAESFAQSTNVLAGHNGTVTSVAYSGDGKRLASAASDGSIVVWDLASGESRATIYSPSSPATSVALSEDGSVLAVGASDGALRLFRVADGERIAEVTDQVGEVRALAFSPNGQNLASAGGLFATNGAAVLRDPATAAAQAELVGPKLPVYALAWSPDSSLIATGGGRFIKPGQVFLFAPGAPNQARALAGSRDVVRGLAFSSDGSLVAAGGREAAIRFWTTDDGEPSGTIIRCGDEIFALAFARQGKSIVALSERGTLKMWRVADGRLEASLCTPRVSAAAFTRNGSHLAFGTADGMVAVWDITTMDGWRLLPGSHLQPCDEALCGVPNIILVVADDVGWGDIGAYGQKQILTPHIDRLAHRGARLVNYYAGAPVGIPSRCSLLTGLHTGHGRLRGNQPELPLALADVTVAEVLRMSGYATGLVGKWSLGGEETSGLPRRQGFQSFYGFLTRAEAENHYPPFIWRNETKIDLPGNADNKREHYAQDLLTAEALDFIGRKHEKPFFLMVSYTIVRANAALGQNGLEVPSDAPYSDRPWPAPQKNYAAMITRLDADVGKIVDRLAELHLLRDTAIFVTSDNGPHADGGADPGFFQSAGPFRGRKGSLNEGGIRVPMIVHWPRGMRGGQVAEKPAAHWDFLATCADLAGSRMLPRYTDGVSLMDTLGLPLLPIVRGASPQYAAHGRGGVKILEFVAPAPLRAVSLFARPLYFEKHDGGFAQAVRFGYWKALRAGGKDGPIDLYNLFDDPGETTNVAAMHPEVVEQAKRYLDESRVPSADWPAPGE
jgi:arylsulfatase A-like enzyme/WD40 repeat protein